MTQPSYLHSVYEDRARFEAGKETTDNGNPPRSPAPPADGNGRSSAKPRAERPIPTNRLKFENQVAVLTAVARTSGNSRRGMSANAMSAAIDLSGGTGGLNSRFFRSVGWFESVGRGEYTASAGLLAWNQHLTVDPDGHYEAAAGMRDEFRKSWVWEALGELLVTGQPISMKLALLELAKAAGAHDHTAQLETIVEWMEWVGLVLRDGDQVQLRREELTSTSPAAAPTAGAASSDDTRSQPESPEDEVTEDADPVPSAGAEQGDAILSFNLSVRLTADELSNMDQDQRDFLLAFAERLRG